MNGLLSQVQVEKITEHNFLVRSELPLSKEVIGKLLDRQVIAVTETIQKDTGKTDYLVLALED